MMFMFRLGGVLKALGDQAEGALVHNRVPTRDQHRARGLDRIERGVDGGLIDGRRGRVRAEQQRGERSEAHADHAASGSFRLPGFIAGTDASSGGSESAG